MIGLLGGGIAGRWPVAFWEKVHWNDHDTSNESGDCLGGADGVCSSNTEPSGTRVSLWW